MSALLDTGFVGLAIGMGVALAVSGINMIRENNKFKRHLEHRYQRALNRQANL